MKTQFTWDKQKAATNLQKHQISFDVAIRVFADPFALTAQDRIENGEYRWQTIGRIEGCLILLVAHTIVEDDNTETIRIISARRVDSKERKRYEEFNR